MKNTLILLLLISCMACNTNRNKRKEAFDFLPKNTSVVIKLKNNEAAKNDINSNSLIASFSDSSKVKSALASIELASHFNTNDDILIALNPSENKDSLNFTFITKLKDSLFKLDSLSTPKSNKKIVSKQSIGDQDLFGLELDSFYIASTSKTLAESIAKTKKKTTNFSTFKNVSSQSSISLFIAAHQKKTVAIDSIDSDLKLLGHLTNLDINISEDDISLNGISKLKDSTLNFISYAAKTLPQQNTLADIIPNNGERFLSFTFNDYNTLRNNYWTFNGTTPFEDEDLSGLIVEIGNFKLNKNEVYAARSLDIITTKDFFNPIGDVIDSYREVDIFSLNSSQETRQLFLPLLQFETDNSLYFFLDDFIIFTESVEDAQSIISNYKNQTTLSKSPVYLNVKEQLSDESSMLFFSTSNTMDAIISQNLTEELQDLDLQKFNSKAFQIVNDNGFAHVNLIAERYKAKAVSNSISEESVVTLDNELLNAPQVVKNHISGQKDILVQDVNNNLYLVSNRGKILWKKKINGNVLGKVNQIDIYKNGRLQLVFATPKTVYVLDRNGKDVGPFPMKFNDEITQPLSVFDYDNNKNYRLMVVQGQNVLMYNTKGKTVTGFTFKKAANAIITQPKHFRVGNKDYIVFGAGKTLYILDRRGNTRINVKESIDFSQNEIFLYKGLFTTTNTLGQLVQVDQKGRTNKQNLLLPKDHTLQTTSKTMVTLADNKLNIKSNPLELDFGEYTAPKIFYLRDKIYVALTDLQTQKIYLYDSQARLLPNFPVYGTSSIELDNIDKDKNLEFVVKGENKSVIIYKLN